MKRTRKGFTLIELLVVISVLGAIAAMMSISSGEAMTSAKAGNIINNLRNFVTAANEYYFDHMSDLYSATAEIDLDEIKLYMNEGVSETTDTPESKLANYYVVNAVATNKSVAEVDWYVGYKFPSGTEVGAAEALAIKEKMKGRAKNIGLYGSAAANTAPTNADGKNAPAAYDGEAVIWMRAREASRRTASGG